MTRLYPRGWPVLRPWPLLTLCPGRTGGGRSEAGSPTRRAVKRTSSSSESTGSSFRSLRLSVATARDEWVKSASIAVGVAVSGRLGDPCAP
jgi:hypothetical protein